MLLMLVGTIGLVAFVLIGTVGMVFAIVPIVVVMVPRVVDSDLDMLIIGCCSSRD